MTTLLRALRRLIPERRIQPPLRLTLIFTAGVVGLALLVAAACAPRTTPVAPPVPMSGGVVASTWTTPVPPTPADVATVTSILPPAATPVALATVTPVAQPQARAIPSPAAGDSRFAVLLMGYGGPGHDGPYLTDSMMLVMVDPSMKRLTLVSIPRDSWVPLEFDGETATYSKINTAYAFAEDSTMGADRLARYIGANGPGRFAADTVARILGVPVDYYLGLDFQGFRQMVDAMGGVSVDVPASFTARYPANDNASIDPSWMTIHFYRGQQTMYGERALEFARAREAIDNPGEASDFARSRRQRLIIDAFKSRLLAPGGLVHLPQLVGIAAQHVDTDYSIPAAAQLANLVVGWKDVQVFQTALTTDNYLEEGTGPDDAYVLLPSSPDHSWAQIRAFARRLRDDPLSGLAMASTQVVVVNRSGSPGLATRVSASLAQLGYRVVTPTEGSFLSQSRIVDRSGGTGAAALQQLSRDLGLVGPDVLAEGNGGGGIAVELGGDAADLSIDVPPDEAAPAGGLNVVQVGSWNPAPSTSTQQTPLERDRGAQPGATSGREGLHATPIPVPGNAKFVVVPRLVGLPETVAQQFINESDLMTTYVNYQTIDQVPDHALFLSTPPGAVLSQLPPPGTQVPRGTRIMLAVRKQ